MPTLQEVIFLRGSFFDILRGKSSVYSHYILSEEFQAYKLVVLFFCLDPKKRTKRKLKPQQSFPMQAIAWPAVGAGLRILASGEAIK
jgi:hypothetical protein